MIVRFGGEEQHEENRVHLGNAIMSFYSALIDLLGRCAPEMHVSKVAFNATSSSLTSGSSVPVNTSHLHTACLNVQFCS